MPDEKTEDWGSFEQAEAWRRESFLARTPAERLAWLKAALSLKYQAERRVHHDDQQEGEHAQR